MMAHETLAAWRRLLWMGRVEGATLVLLLFVAVPLKHLLGVPALSRVLGPVHGVVFLAYLWTALEAASASVDEDWSERLPLWRLVACSLVPFGTWILDARIRDTLARTEGQAPRARAQLDKP